ncbi:hypothetical protein [Chitinimonas lacunae]|uniref:HEAT repeat domain-containing protein n=1 Tax=Chitinimonas lacunae TaxID=1963018 RepID=A0ABV8MWC2_9NEIS
MKEVEMSILSEQLQRLKDTKDSVERNALAIDVTEKGDPSVQAVLVELIDRPDLSDQRATLVNCLGKFDCSNKFLWLVNLVCQGNWEVAHEAFNILTDIELIDSKEAKLGFDVLSKSLESCALDDWRKKLIADLLAMFD